MKIRHALCVGGWGLMLIGAEAGAQSVTDGTTLLTVAPAAEHCEDAVATGDFLEVFVCGDEFFETLFNAADGVGANVGEGQRFTKLPRADLDDDRQWANHFPERATGPNAGACNSCHNLPVGTAAGLNALNVIRDPFHEGKAESMIVRNTPSLLGAGALQVLAEEMNEDLEAIVASAIDEACTPGDRHNVTADLTTKGVNFGTVQVEAGNGGAGNSGPCPRSVEIRENGVDEDLIVKPYQWKGSDPTIRVFNRGAFHNEIGMQPVETVGDGVDGDFDGVVDEVSIADSTATAVYIAGQPRPTTTVELSDLRDTLIALDPVAGLAEADELGLPSLTAADKAAIAAGEAVFSSIGCAGCHMPALEIEDAIFNEPSENPNYRDAVFPAGQDPVTRGVDPSAPVSFDLTADLPDNIIELGGSVVASLGNFESNGSGGAIVRLFGDLKRHEMGERLLENIDEVGTGRSTWMTKELWGVGSTGQYMHHGGASTIEEAILDHGGEAGATRAAFNALSVADQTNLVAFVNSLILLKAPEEESTSPPPPSGQPCFGDCNADGEVSIDELIVAVSIALGLASVADCGALDANGDGIVAVNEVVAGVNNALGGCPA